MNNPRCPIVHWMKEVVVNEEAGYIICPLMTTDPGRFPVEICRCDIPKTRAFYLARVPSSCVRNGVCRPHKVLDHMAGEETNPRIVPRSKRPHGAWTAVFKRDLK
jgi:hypothetical protein